MSRSRLNFSFVAIAHSVLCFLLLFCFDGIFAKVCPELPPLVNSTLKVHPSLREHPFDVTRQMVIPQGYSLELYARVLAARFMLLLPNGDVLVAQMRIRNPLPGTVAILRRSPDDGLVTVSTFINNLRRPHGLALAKDGRQMYIYIAESHRVARYPYNLGDTRAGLPVQIVIDYLNDDLVVGGWYEHPLKNIVIKDNYLYMSIASQTNENPELDLGSVPVQAAVYRYTLSGHRPTLIAVGLRNAEGLDFNPRTGEMWTVVNGRDFVKYPYHDGTGRYGEQFDEYMDENPPETFVKVVLGAHYGWPYCTPVSSDTMDDIGYVFDVDRNPDERVINCSLMRRTDKGLAPHCAPLGLKFWTGRNAPAAFKNGAVIGLHGSSTLGRKKNINGNTVVFFRFLDGRPGPQYTLIQGWEKGTYASRWGRPVAPLPLEDGSLLISDDFSGSVYRLYKNDNTNPRSCY